MPVWGLVKDSDHDREFVVLMGVLVTHQSQLLSGPSTLQGADVPQRSPALFGSRDTAPGATVSSEYISLHNCKYNLYAGKTEMKLEREFTGRNVLGGL